MQSDGGFSPEFFPDMVNVSSPISFSTTSQASSHCVKAHSQFVALSCNATGCHRAVFATIYEHKIASATCPAAPRREDRTEFYPMRRGAPRWLIENFFFKGVNHYYSIGVAHVHVTPNTCTCIDIVIHKLQWCCNGRREAHRSCAIISLSLASNFEEL